MVRKAITALALLGAAVYPAVSLGQADAAKFPKVVSIVVPFSAGSSTDAFGRFLAQELGPRIGSNVIVDNRPGAGGSIAFQHVASAPGDGSVVLLSSSAFVTTPAVLPKLSYDPIKGFTPIAMLATAPYLLTVGMATPYKTTAELLDAARADKGKINYGSTGVGSSHHLMTELLNSMAGSQMNHIPYKGGTGAIVDVISGQIQVLILSVPALMPQVKNGKIRALAVTSANRSRFAPDLPTVSATVPGFVAETWWGTFVSSSTPAPLAERLHAEMNAIAASPKMREMFEKEGADSAKLSSGEFAAHVRTEVNRFRDVARKHKIVAE